MTKRGGRTAVVWLVLLSLSILNGREGAAQPPDPRAELDTAYQKGFALCNAGKPAEAIPLLEKAASLAPQVFGPTHLNTAGVVSTLGRSYLEAGRYREAEAHIRRGLEIREAKLGKDHLKVADSLNNLAVVCDHLGQSAEAASLGERCLAIRQAKLPSDDPLLANTCNNLAAAYYHTARYAEAESLYKRCLQIQEARLGVAHRDAITSRGNLAELYRDMGRYAEAEDLGRRNLQLAEAAGGKDDLRVASCLNTLGLLYYFGDRVDEAEPLLRRALAIREAALGKDHPAVAHVLGNLAGLCIATGRMSEAELLHRRSLAIREASFGKDQPEVAISLEGLAGLYGEIGRTAEAEALFRRAIEIYETKLGKDHPDVSHALANLAGLYRVTARYREAEALLQRCLQIDKARLGEGHPDFVRHLSLLAIVYSRTGRYREAEALLRKSLMIDETRLGKNHPNMAAGLHNLGLVCWRLGRLEEAEQCLERSARLNGTAQGTRQSNAAMSLLALAGLNEAMNRPEQAMRYQDRCLQIYQASLRDVFGFSSEAAMHAFLGTMTGVLPCTISLAAAQEPGSPAVTTALTWTLRLKGVVLDTLCRYRQTQQLLAPDDAFAQRLARLRALKQKLADAALNPPQGSSPEQVKEQLARSSKEAENLEAELHRALAAKQPASANEDQAVTAAAVQERLPPGAALVEFCKIMVRDFKRDEWGDEHYFAFVLTSGRNPPQLIDLGAAKGMDAGVEAVRQEFTDFQEKLRDCESPEEIQALEKAREKEFHQVALRLYSRLFAPLRKALGGTGVLYIAPDGALNRLPFETLVDEDGKYLAERYRCAYLSSGRDLLRRPAPTARGTVIFADPDYKLDAVQRLALAEKLPARTQPAARSSTPARGLRSAGWKRLPGAEAEARAIEEILRDSAYGPVKSYLGAAALEETLKALPAPRVLHLATHGFFLDHEPAEADSSEEGIGAGWARGRLRHMDNPLLRSGIVLAGANTVGDREGTGPVEDGWVTAEEIALLNLRGTDLVVLSACQTGLGDVRTGEGVYGLRRAFLYAGARTLVTSLFEVPDKETSELMARFYRGLRSGQAELAALHAAQEETIRRRRQAQGAAHPFFWACFVLVGDPE